jgi:hypothetical protein
MKLKTILKAVGGRILREIPAVGAIMDVVEDITGKPVAPTDTGDDMLARLNASPEVLEKQFDIKLAEIEQQNETLRAMLAAEAESKHTTRPRIAFGSFVLLAIVTVAIVTGWLYAVFTSTDPLTNLVNGWPFVATLLAPFVTVLLAYFGKLTTEHKNRLDSAHGATNAGGVAGIINAILKPRG